MKLRLQASRVNIPIIAVEAHIGIASLLGASGDHRHAVKNLERILPLARMAARNTPLYYDFLNSFAVELNDAGKSDEASDVINLVLSTPYVRHYPNWPDTGKEIYRKSHRSSMVRIPEIIFDSSEPEPESKPQQPAGIVSFPPLKEAPPPQKPERLAPRELNELTASEKKDLILAAIRSDTIRESRYDKLMDMVGLLKLGPADKALDLEDDAVLDDIIILWSNQIDPEELAAVISALRDCDDSLRQRNIMDRIIRIAFEQTLLCTVTEDEWRRRVERRLPKT
ncbi:MAG TPA: hypothetical protein VJZ26_12605 [Blastocatellia bacterium]|nr:hypothetical protein [Blastocatellia bacterium]